jgi:hypothetical protein
MAAAAERETLERAAKMLEGRREFLHARDPRDRALTEAADAVRLLAPAPAPVAGLEER